MLDGIENSAPRVMDPLGRFLFRGQEMASYLFQVPDDAAQWQRVQEVVDLIVAECSGSKRVELPQIASEMQQLIHEAHSTEVADQLVAAFDRMVRLWKSARSGLLDASRLSTIGLSSPPDPQDIRKRGEPVLWD